MFFFGGLCAIPGCDGGARKKASEKVADDASGIRSEQTENKYRDFAVGSFKRPGGSFSINASGAHFRIGPNTAKFVIGDPQDGENIKFESEFTLSKPGDMFYRPDHHGTMVFTVKSIVADTIVISYRVTFDYRSFGENLVTTDVGEFALQPFDNP